jgi:outer membrane putative beta-barrel porin/alpha-amylase
MRRAVCLLLCASLSIPAVLAEEREDKTGYNLFRPTPDALLRDFATDRPDKTESPITVDAGHFQLEMDFATYTFDRTNHETTKAWAVAPTNFKVGVLNNVDLQVVVQTYNTQTTEDRDTGRKHRVSGFGDVTLRCKTNFWGNDSGFSAFGMMPFVKLPAAGDGIGNGAVEGGVILPFLLRLPADWEIGMDIVVGHIKNDVRGGYHQEAIQSITVGHDIGKWSGYLEFFSDVSNEPHTGWVATVDCGATYRLTRDVQLDAGVNIGLTSAADDVNPFVGLSVRY